MKYEYRPTQFVHNFKGMTKKKKGKKKTHHFGMIPSLLEERMYVCLGTLQRIGP